MSTMRLLPTIVELVVGVVMRGTDGMQKLGGIAALLLEDEELAVGVVVVELAEGMFMEVTSA